MPVVIVSVTVTDCKPADLSVTVKVCTPLSPPGPVVNVYGVVWIVPIGSLVVTFTVSVKVVETLPKESFAVTVKEKGAPALVVLGAETTQ